MQVRNAGHPSKDVLLFFFFLTELYNIPSANPSKKHIQFSVMVYRHKYTWCQIYKKKIIRNETILLGFMHQDPRLQRIRTGSTNDFGAFLFSTS